MIGYGYGLFIATTPGLVVTQVGGSPFLALSMEAAFLQPITYSRAR
jgi:hypothetical protein